MAKTPTNFKTETQLGVTATELTAVAVGSASVNVVRAVSFFNQSLTLTETIKVYRHTTTTTISDDNLIIQKDIPPRKTVNVVELQGKVISPGFSLSATSTTAATVNAECDGIVSS